MGRGESNFGERWRNIILGRRVYDSSRNESALVGKREGFAR